MCTAQKGKCAICNEVPDYMLYIDHCHKTLKVRGLLCPRCNNLVGQLETNGHLIHKATEYIDEHK